MDSGLPNMVVSWIISSLLSATTVVDLKSAIRTYVEYRTVMDKCWPDHSAYFVRHTINGERIAAAGRCDDFRNRCSCTYLVNPMDLVLSEI